MATPEQTRRRKVAAFIIGALLLVLLLFSCSVGVFGGKDDGTRPQAAAPTTDTATPETEPEKTPEVKPEQSADTTDVAVVDDVYVPVGSPVVPVEPIAPEPTVVPVVDVATPTAPPATCATDPSLCPPPPTPTCETDPSLCPPPADTTPPTCPTDLAVSAISAKSAFLTWGAASDNRGVAGYTVILNGDVVGHSSDREFTLTDLSPAQEYTVRVVAYDAAGNVSADCGSQTFRTPLLPDLLPPTIPTDVACTTVDETTVEVTWTESTDNVKVDHYEVFANGEPVRDPATGDVVAYAKPPATVTALDAGTAYDFTVKAVDGSGNVSFASQAASCTTLEDTEAPTAPTKLNVDAITDTTATVSWSGAGDNVAVTKYVVQVQNMDTGAITTQDSTTESVTVTGLAPSTPYRFAVTAYDAAGNASVLSPGVNGTTLAPDTAAPSVPSGLVASDVTSTGFTVSWDASSDDRSAAAAITYEVFVNGASVGTVTGSTTLAVSGRLPSSTYKVTVTATDEAGNTSAPSSALSVTTEPLIVLPLLRSSSTSPSPTPEPTDTAAAAAEPTATATTEPAPSAEPTTSAPAPTGTPAP